MYESNSSNKLIGFIGIEVYEFTIEKFQNEVMLKKINSKYVPREYTVDVSNVIEFANPNKSQPGCDDSCKRSSKEARNFYFFGGYRNSPFGKEVPC
jgi:hypothetical protein